ncbi:MAG: hypothetical protein WC453_05030 [Patescibacteria group bacterium]
MARTFTEINLGTDLMALDFVNEIAGAYSERRQVLGDSAFADFTAGYDMSDHDLWVGIQQWMETNCVSFIDYDETIVGTQGPTMLTLAAMRSKAGLHADGFRRAREWPEDWTDPNDPAYEHGVMQMGDIIGPWIFDDLQKAFDALRWTVYGIGGVGISWSAEGETNYAYYGVSGFTDWVTTTASGTTMFNSFPTTGVSNYQPIAYTWAYYYESGGFNHYIGFLVRRYAYGKYADIPTHIKHSLDFYAYARAPFYGNWVRPTDAFNENGDGYTWDIWNLIESKAESDDSEFLSVNQVGNTGLTPAPAWCNEPDEPVEHIPPQSTDQVIIEGYILVGALVFKWDGPEGFAWHLY